MNAVARGAIISLALLAAVLCARVARAENPVVTCQRTHGQSEFPWLAPLRLRCPNTVIGATTVIGDVKNGVELTITSKDVAAIKEIRARVAALVTGSADGNCPVVTTDTTFAVSEVPGGTKISVVPKDEARVEALRSETRSRQLRLVATTQSALVCAAADLHGVNRFDVNVNDDTEFETAQRTLALNLHTGSKAFACLSTGMQSADAGKATQYKFTCQAPERLVSPRLEFDKTTVELSLKNIGPSAADPPANLDAISAEARSAVLQSLALPDKSSTPGHYYNEGADRAVVFFNAAAIPYYPMIDQIDENDSLTVVVIDYSYNLEGKTISIEGCDRVATKPASYDANASQLPAKRQLPTDIGLVVRQFGACKGAKDGGPKLVITAGSTTNTAQVPVNSLTRLSVGVALGYDFTRGRSYSLRAAPGDTVPRITQSDESLGLTALFLVSFHLHARDFKKTGLELCQRTQLFAAVDPRALDKHLIFGIGFEMTEGLNVILGLRVATKQPVLADGSGVSVGKTFDGTAESIPTRDQWRFGSAFVGVGVSTDLLARLK